MQFRDLGAQYRALQGKIDESVASVLSSGRFIGGSVVSGLEGKLANYVGSKHCITCGNGTDALQLALMAWKIGPGDAVIVPDFTFFSSGEVVAALGATPVFVDVDDATYNIYPSQIEPAFFAAKDKGLDPKAVIAVDLFGLPASYPDLRTICTQLGLLILEDGAQGFGGSIEGKRACSFGDISTTSFFPAKPLGCYGDGGAVFTDNDDWAELIRSYAVHGKGTMKYDNVRVGMNSRLDAVQAAILECKLEAFEAYELRDIDDLAALYTMELAPLSDAELIQLPFIPEGYGSSWAQYTIQLSSNIYRDKLQEKLASEGIPSMIYYPKPMHEQIAFQDNMLYVGDAEASRSLCSTVLSLPISPYMEKSAVAVASDALTRFIS